jgi:hypothetical protein
VYKISVDPLGRSAKKKYDISLSVLTLCLKQVRVALPLYIILF